MDNFEKGIRYTETHKIAIQGKSEFNGKEYRSDRVTSQGKEKPSNAPGRKAPPKGEDSVVRVEKKKGKHRESKTRLTHEREKPERPVAHGEVRKRQLEYLSVSAVFVTDSGRESKSRRRERTAEGKPGELQEEISPARQVEGKEVLTVERGE